MKAAIASMLLLALHHRPAECHALSSAAATSSSNARPLQIFYDSTNCLHRDGTYHPECPERIDHCLDALRRHYSSEGIENPGMLMLPPTSHLIDVATANANHPIIPSDDAAAGQRQECSSSLTEPELEHATDMLSVVHEPSYVASLRGKCEASSRQMLRLDEGKDDDDALPLPLGWMGYIDGSDTFVTTESYNVGVRATGAWIRAVDAALLGSDHQASMPKGSAGTSSIALTRPPGHHATHASSSGFCIFNFAMAAAAHALSIDPSMKVSILDWDVHFGQGVMDILDKCSSNDDDGEEGAEGKNDWTSHVRYASLHQVPCFPYEGQSRKVRGRYDNVMTIPVQPESTWHCGYKDLFSTYALPFVCSRDEWEPDLVIVCAGYDALDSDDLASVNLVSKDYGEMTRLLREQIIGCCSRQPALVLGLEGGYQLRDGVAGGNLSDALIETIKALHG